MARCRWFNNWLNDPSERTGVACAPWCGCPCAPSPMYSLGVDAASGRIIDKECLGDPRGCEYTRAAVARGIIQYSIDAIVSVDVSRDGELARMVMRRKYAIAFLSTNHDQLRTDLYSRVAPVGHLAALPAQVNPPTRVWPVHLESRWEPEG